MTLGGTERWPAMIRSNRMLASVATLTMMTTPLAARAQDPHAGHHPAADAPAPAATGMSNARPKAGQSETMTGPEGGDMTMSRDIEEHLSRMRSELHITPAQLTAWTAYENALRTIAADMGHAHREMMAAPGAGEPLSPIERLDRHDRMLASMRDNLHRLRPVLAQIYAVLSSEQKRKAEVLLVPHDGMMVRMSRCGMMRK